VSASESSARPTTIAFYLPQFYPIAANDAWYGRGFTEWRNVVRARPLFDGHYQPRLPADLGFYDLRVREVREQQARLAHHYGIDAFMYYHYWFAGERPLKIVIDDMLADGVPDMPFCLCWANENWSRHWDATAHEVLLKQTYSPEDDEAHGQFLLRALSHPRYLRVNGKPVLFLYRMQAMPDPRGTLARWREMWRAAGIGEVEIIKFDTHGNVDDPAAFGADAAAQFVPHSLRQLVPRMAVQNTHPNNLIFDYAEAAERYLAGLPAPWTRHPCVATGWDNTARRGDGLSAVIHGSTPELYEKWLRRAHAAAPDDGMVLINAWNEWAEGAYLEPDLEYGHAYLEATARAIGHPVEVDHAWADEASVPGADEGHSMTDLYLDAYDEQLRLRRQLSRLEGMVDRQIGLAQQRAAAELAEARAHAAQLAAEVQRLTERQVNGLREPESSGT